jgi:hypothetical protein
VRRYAIWGTATSPAHEEWVRAVGKQFEADDFVLVDDIADADFVLNMFDAEDPKAFRRASRGTYSAAFYELDEAPEDPLKASYPMLVRTLSNVVLMRVPGTASGSRRWSRARTTCRGSRDDLRPPRAARDVTLVIDNEWIPDLEPDLWDGDDVTVDISEAGGGSTSSTCCPRRSPSRSICRAATCATSCACTRSVGLSYGNLSARKDETRFWMSASGVDKSKLESSGATSSWSRTSTTTAASSS